MIRIEDKHDCCGCMACVQVCPRKCITAVTDEEGFAYPAVDTAACIDCGLCEKACPCLAPRHPRSPAAIVAAVSNDETIRSSSSSGGIFTHLAERILARGGRVFGAAFDRRWNVCHRSVADPEALVQLRGSKYVQSDTRTTFAETEALLRQGIPVLYSGTPCQIAGLRAFLGREYDDLYTVDFTCHGVPSPGVWQRYLRERLAECLPGEEPATDAIEQISFRDKRLGWREFTLSIDTEKMQIAESRRKDIWLKGFLANLYLRPSCHTCRFRNFSSGSDLTVSDFWNIRRYLPEMDDGRGTSLVYLHTDKGTALLDRETSRIEELRHYKYPEAVYAPASGKAKRSRFFARLRRGEEPLRTIVDDLSRSTFWEKKRRRFKNILRNLTLKHEDRYFDATPEA